MTLLINSLKEEHSLKRRLYSRAKKQGLKLQVYRSGDHTDPDYQTFRLLNRESGAIVYAAGPDRYGLTLAQVEEFLSPVSGSATTQPGEGVESKTGVEQRPDRAEQERAEEIGTPAETGVCDARQVEKVTRIADTNIPSGIIAIFNLMEFAASSDKDPSQCESWTDEGAGCFRQCFRAWKLLKQCTNRELALYMFTRLLAEEGHPKS